MRALPLLFLALLARADGLDRHLWADAIEAKSRSYVVETNTFPELARSLADTLQDAYAFYEDRFGPLEGTARRPMRIALFRTESEYLGVGGGVEGAIGHFDSALDRCAFVWRGESGEHGWPIAIHEACHHYFRRRFPDVAAPSWYSEGIACYFEGLRDPAAERGISRVRVRAAKTAYEAGDAKLSLLLVTRAQVREGRLQLQNFPPSRYYALAWSLCHFLATDPAMKEAFRRFELRLFASRVGASAREAHARTLLEEECGDLPGLEQRWHTHLAALPLPQSPPLAPVYAWELTSENAFVRYAALRRIEEGALPEGLRDPVAASLRDGDLVVRAAAARIFSSQMAPDVVPAMAEALDAGDDSLRAVAFAALAHPAAGAAVPRLMRETRDRDEAIEALATIRDPRAFPLLRDAVTDPLLSSRARSRSAAALRADPDAALALSAAAHDADTAVRTAARASLVALGHDPAGVAATLLARQRAAAAAAGDAIEAMDLLRTAETTGEPIVRGTELLEDHRLLLLSILDDASAPPETKARACLMLGAARAEEAVPHLRRLCRPREKDAVRLAAVRALVRITGETKGFAEGQSPSRREAALRAWAPSE